MSGSPPEPTRGRTPGSTTTALRVDADFARSVLDDLYVYRRKRGLVAWAFWAALGWLGAHRFYLERPLTGLLQLLTGGGVLVWWLVDAWRIGRMVDEHNAEQERRERAGEPPLELAFMPPLAIDVVERPPGWTEQWHARGKGWRAMRLAGDVLVLMIAGAALGALVHVEGGMEATFAVVALIGVTLLGGRAEWLNGVPLARALIRWSHRLRLFYYFNRPGNPVALMFRSAVGLMLAPFRRRDRAETRLYLELGAVFTLAFMALDVLEDVVVPIFTMGFAALSPLRLATLWFQELFITFLVTYAFAAPIGAILTLYLLTRRTHTLPRALGVLTLFFIALTAI